MDEHDWNEPLPTDVTESGIETVVRLEQPLNAEDPMVSIVSGIVTAVMAVQNWNAKGTTEVTVSIIVTHPSPAPT